MAIYNVNLNRQVFVVNSVNTVAAKKEPSTLGELSAFTTKDGKQVFFKHIGQGGLVRSDILDTEKISYVKITKGEDMRRKLHKATISLSEDVNEGNPIAWQDYVLRVQINNFLAPGDACVYIKSSAVRATKNMTAADFYKKMVESLKVNFSREVNPMLTFEATDSGIVVTEYADQPWRLGVLSQEPVNFEVHPTTVTFESNEVIWGTVEYSEADEYISNGRQIADLEYFCQAERGDMFRNMGWPNNIDVKYMVDPDKEYSLLDIHYAYSGDGVQVHKSEKDITFVATDATVLDSIVSELKTLGVAVQE